MTDPLTPYLAGVLKLYAAHAGDGIDPVHGTPIHPGKVYWLRAGFPQLAKLGLIRQGADGVWAITDDGTKALEQQETTK